MELREPPMRVEKERGGRLGWWMVLQALLLAVVLFFVVRLGGDEEPDAERLREVASKLRAAGALEESARVLDEYLSRVPPESERYASMAYTLGDTYLELGAEQKALRWFYAAEAADDGSLEEGIGRKIVHSLERLGRYHAAQAALDSRVRMSAGTEGDAPGRATEDPVVARIGDDEIRRSEVERAMDDLPPQLAQSLTSVEARREFLRQYVAEELLWRKAQKLEYDEHPEVKRQLERVWRQLAMGKFVEDEVVAGVEADEADLRNYFTANRERFRPPQASEDAEPPTFEDVRPRVEALYRQEKVRAAYDELLESQLSAQGVELLADRMAAGGDG